MCIAGNSSINSVLIYLVVGGVGWDARLVPQTNRDVSLDLSHTCLSPCGSAVRRSLVAKHVFVVLVGNGVLLAVYVMLPWELRPVRRNLINSAFVFLCDVYDAYSTMGTPGAKCF